MMSSDPPSRAPIVGGAARGKPPWQLKMFSKSLKKRQKLDLLLRQIGDTRGRRCVLVTHGDNNGALNYHFRAHGGSWVWVEMEPNRIPEIEELLGEPVLEGEPTGIPLADGAADLVIAIDVHEHLAECAIFNRELGRIVRPGGTVVVTTPNGDRFKPVTVLKRWLGMTPEVYGHRVIGYSLRQHREMLRQAGLEPLADGSYSKFFTELIELAINLAYVKVLAGRSEAEVEQGTIAPTSREQLRSVEKQVRLYSVLYPVLWGISRLDLLLFFWTGYAVSVTARKPG